MIVRIVKMTFEASKVEDFQKMFEEKKERIRGFEGCQRLELLRDASDSNVFFTYSFWNEAEDLESYRHSDLFKETWKFTKSLFSDKPETWSLNQEVVLT